MLILLILSSLLILTGFIVTEKNAKNLLSGYNTMTEEERKGFDLKLYIGVFRKFHLFLGISMFVLGVVFSRLIGELGVIIFMVIYPIAAYIFFLWNSRKYYTGKTQKWNKIGIIILLITLFGIAVLLISGFRENKINISSAEIVIGGMYGEKIPVSDIQSVCLTDGLPQITMRTNGFAIGDIRKGFFKTFSNEKVKFILNLKEKPFLVITKKSGEKIFYSSGSNKSRNIFTEILTIMPGKNCK